MSAWLDPFDKYKSTKLSASEKQTVVVWIRNSQLNRMHFTGHIQMQVCFNVQSDLCNNAEGVDGCHIQGKAAKGASVP